jgi:iron complex transport system substrate-binding protein
MNSCYRTTLTALSFRVVTVLFFFIFAVSAFAAGQIAEPVEDDIVLEETASPLAILEETDTTVTFQEADGNVVEIPKFPKRTATCYNSLLDLWDIAGGEAICRVKGTTNVPEKAADLPQIGSIGTLNIEKMMELQPDLIIFYNGEHQKKVREIFNAEGIPSVMIDYDTYDDYRVILDLFTRITGNREIYEQEIIPTQKQFQAVINQAPTENNPTVCILFASTRYVKVETVRTNIGNFCERLNAINIYREDTIEGASRVELSLEYIVEQDPDVIFVTTMGDVDKCKSRVEQDVTSSDIWGDLTAVKNGRFHYLDKSYSIYKPNRFYPEAIKTVAELLYPEMTFTLPDLVAQN